MDGCSRQAIAKRQGRNAAKVWLASAATADKVMLAGFDFRYGEDMLDDLRKEGIEVPSSSDPHYSWGFFKQVEGHVFNKVHVSGGTSRKGIEH